MPHLCPTFPGVGGGVGVYILVHNRGTCLATLVLGGVGLGLGLMLLLEITAAALGYVYQGEVRSKSMVHFDSRFFAIETILTFKSLSIPLRKSSSVVGQKITRIGMITYILIAHLHR